MYSSELYPGEWRALGVSTSLSAILWGCLIFTAAAPQALATIGALYYVVFIVLTTIQFFIVVFFFPDVSLLVLAFNCSELTLARVDQRLHSGADDCRLR